MKDSSQKQSRLNGVMLVVLLGLSISQLLVLLRLRRRETPTVAVPPTSEAMLNQPVAVEMVPVRESPSPARPRTEPPTPMDALPFAASRPSAAAAAPTQQPSPATAAPAVHLPPAIAANRLILGRAAGVAAIILMILSGYGFRWQEGQDWVPPNDGITFLILGAVALGVSIFLLRPKLDMFQFARTRMEVSGVRWPLVVVGAVLLALMAQVHGDLGVVKFALSQHVQVLFLVGGTVLVAYGLGGFKDLSLRPLLRRSALPLIVITLVALGIRAWNLDGAVHIMVDELHFYDGVVHLREDANFPVLQPLDGIATFPHLFSYVEQWTIALFGGDFVGIRMTSVLFGTLTIPATYLLAKAITDRKTALMAAALMAAFPPEIHFSRLALNNIADPLFGTLAIGCLVNALRYNRQRDYVLAGLFLGFTSYFYEGGRLLFLGLFVLWLGFMLVAHRPWQNRRGFILMGIMAALIFFPYYYTSASVGTGLSPRLTDQGRLGYLLQDLRTLPADQVLLTHYNDALRPALFHSIYSPDASNFYYGGSSGILIWYMVIFYFLGLFYALFRMRSMGVLLWLWVVFALIGISFVVSTDWTVRFCVMFPVMTVLVAIGLRYPIQMVWPERLTQRSLTGLLAVATLGLCAVLVTNYFGPHLTLYNEQVRDGVHDFYDAFDRASKLLGISEIVFITPDFVYTPVMDTLRVFSNIELTYDVWNPVDGFADKLANLPRDQGYAFALNPGDEATLNQVEAVFPVTEGPWSSYASVPFDHEYALYLYQPAAGQ